MAQVGHKGSWFGLPDYNITENIAKFVSGGRTTDLGNAALVRPSPAVSSPRPVQTSKPSGGQTLGASTYSGGGAYTNAGAFSGGGAPAPSGGGGGAPSGPSEMDIINQEFNETQNVLGEQEGLARSQAESGRKLVTQEYGQAQQNIQNERGLRQEELGQRTTQAGLDAQQGVTRIKQNLSELTQRTQAFLASLGGGAGGSSVAAALGERLGRTGQQQMGGLETERVKTLNAINLEGQKVNNFFSQKLSELELNKTRAIEDINTQLNQRLSQISGLRAESRINKARATMDAWRDYSQQVAGIRQNVFNLQQQLTSWALEKTNSLKQAQEFAIGATPNVNPADFGIVRPDQAIGTGVGQTVGPVNPYGTGTRVSIAQGQQNEDDPYQMAAQGLPSSVRL